MTKESLDGDCVFLIRGFATPLECEAFIVHSEKAGYEDAAITTAQGFVMNKDVRDNSRLIEDDQPLADRLWQRARPFVPSPLNGWRAVALNERFRYYRYDRAQQFAPHGDGSFRRANGEESQLTFMVYLNDNYTGGDTKFYSELGASRVSVRPERGAALVFAHRQLHEGAPVVQGRKYVLRTDVMYAEAE